MELSKQISRLKVAVENYNGYKDDWFLDTYGGVNALRVGDLRQILTSLRRLQAIEEAGEMPEEARRLGNYQVGSTDIVVLSKDYDALRLHTQHLASKELK